MKSISEDIREAIMKGASVTTLIKMGYPQNTIHFMYMRTLRQRDQERGKQ